ncbi:DUF6625 family protein [Enterococcus faecium]|uniref:DUF6625 family protein n=1 Tax=Enterococcus faecium TaxID=1352 RepID=UPI00339021B1
MTEKLSSVCLISVYFGKFPDWINVWFLSLKHNPTIDFILVTDQNVDTSGYDNLKVINTDLDSFKMLLQSKLGMKIKLNSSYKLCDYKLVWGLALENEISKYDYWGHSDMDVVYGDIRSFLIRYKLCDYDKFGNRGHLTLYRNTKEVAERYRLTGSWFGSYKEIFKSNRIWAFDETPGINAIYNAHNFSHMNSFIYADIDVNYKDLRLVDRNDPQYVNYQNQVFYWKKGKLLRAYSKDGTMIVDEFMYIHLQKKRMQKPDFNLEEFDGFYILNGYFEPLGSCITLDDVLKRNIRNDIDLPQKMFGGGYKKDLRFYWLGRRYLNMKYDLKQVIKKLLKR